MRRVIGDSNSCTTRARRIGSQVEFTIFPLAMLCTSPEVRRDSRKGYNRLVDHVGIHDQRRLTEALCKDSLVRRKEYPTESSPQAK
ncbi:hypothetical protein Taro_002806 [Colocasia esculenta]|uniref:Uncharacterized protein n=1 Tax=Colocasia esculenta TaxID=4460 RepID=A0A843TJU3_COLES|nr:hypothetical protein [Colocasia esculenta]